MGAVEALWRDVVEPSWQAYHKHAFDNKKAWSTGYIYGTSGVGKTRFNLEFLGLLAKYLEPHATTQSANHEVEALRAALLNCKTVVLDIQHSDNAITEEEAKWRPEVILGLRLAHAYWLPHVSYAAVRTAFQMQMAKHPALSDTFALRQAGFGVMVPYSGGLGHTEEPLSTALNRVLQSTISQTRGFFVLGAQTVGVLLLPLSAEPILQLVASFQFPPQEGLRTTVVSGQDWLHKGGKPFERLLATLGGNVRAIECLERVLRDEGSPSKSISLDRITRELIQQVGQRFSIESWGRLGSSQFGILLALAGIPVTRQSVVSKPGTPPGHLVTVAQLESAGLVRLLPPPSTSGGTEHWADIWNIAQTDLVVMDIPFVLAQAALAASSHEHPRERELFTGARHILTHFYSNASDFQKLALEHRVLRHSVASEWARRRKRTYVEARDLFCGTICDPSLTKLRFSRAAEVRRLSAPAAGVWWNGATNKEVRTSVNLQDGTTVELRGDPYAIVLSGSNAVSCLLNEQLVHPVNKEALVYIDTKHSQVGAPDDALSYSDDIKALIKKRRYLAEQFPDAEHIMVITSNKPAQRRPTPHGGNTPAHPRRDPPRP